ncbi:MAG TPA: HAD hydrolase-like protein, partial [Opitutaceae bacterium]|nr:HAD hydrolase-like protein [Opitutaceae bacterium]
EGIAEGLRDLDASGVPMGVCTSKRTDIAERVLEMFDVRRFFRFVDGGEVGIKKWQQIENLKAKGLVDRATIMIGDRAVDIEAAHRNGLPGAGVLWGFGSLYEIESARPEHVIATPADMRGLITIRPTRKG